MFRKLLFSGVMMALLIVAMPSPSAEGQAFIYLGDEVTGTFGPGAGMRTYQVSLNSGQDVVLQVVSNEYGATPVTWSLSYTSGSVITVVDQASFLSTNDPIEVPATAIYTLTLAWPGGADAAGYSFILWDVPAPKTFVIAVGQTITPNSAGVGSGNIETPGTVDRYLFTGSSGQQITMRLLEEDFSGSPTLWSLSGPTGDVAVDEPFILSSEVYTLPVNGSYTMEVNPVGGITGSYSFRLIDSQAPYATDDFYVTSETNVLQVNAADGLLANDGDPNDDSLTASLVVDADNGSVSLNADGSFIYTPGLNMPSEVIFTYEVSDGVNTSNTATVRLVTEFPARLYPEDEESITTGEPWPRFSFEQPIGVTWVQAWIGSGSSTVLFDWFEMAEICEEGVCTLPVDVYLANGTYSWWMTYYGTNLTDINSYWNETTFEIDIATPPQPQNIMVSPGGHGRPVIMWDDADDALWYQLYIGGSGYSYSIWFQSAFCSVDQCIFSPAIDWPADGNPYQVWMQAWGPGGFSSPTGANTLDSWVQGPDLNLVTTPPNTPTNFGVTGTDSDNINFFWDQMDDASWYEIVLEPGNWDYSIWVNNSEAGCFEVCGTTDPNLGGGLLDLVAGADAYSAIIRAYGPGGLSEYSTPLNFEYTFGS